MHSSFFLFFFITVSFIYYKYRDEETIQKGNVMKSKNTRVSSAITDCYHTKYHCIDSKLINIQMIL